MAKCIEQATGKRWVMFGGDCVEVLKGLPDDSVGASIYSPPFAGLYIYSDSERDMGNCKSNAEFFNHYKFAVEEIYRATVPGRLTIVHCKDLPAYFHRDGYAGLQDFPGEVIRAHEDCGWRYHSRVTIWKCPVIERERTNNNGLLHKTVMRDRSQLRQGMADYLIVMRKVSSGTLESEVPVGPGVGLESYIGLDDCDPRTADSKHPSNFSRKTIATNDSINIWRRYAEPVWWDINQTNVLNSKMARISEDEKHICPLQLDVIRRAVDLWTQPGDAVLSPFAGIGSEGYCAVKAGRRFIGIELKQSYFKYACDNLAEAELESTQDDLFAV